MSNMTFRKAIHQAIRESDLKFRQRVLLNCALLLPGGRAKIEEHILAQAKTAEIVSDVLALDSEAQFEIDWDKVKEFIKTYLPILIAILFKILI